MRTFIEMRMGEGNFLKRIDRIVDSEKQLMKGGIENVQKEENEESRKS